VPTIRCPTCNHRAAKSRQYIPPYYNQTRSTDNFIGFFCSHCGTFFYVPRREYILGQELTITTRLQGELQSRHLRRQINEIDSRLYRSPKIGNRLRVIRERVLVLYNEIIAREEQESRERRAREASENAERLAALERSKQALREEFERELNRLLTPQTVVVLPINLEKFLQTFKSGDAPVDHSNDYSTNEF
jgi:hypothetical protein